MPFGEDPPDIDLGDDHKLWFIGLHGYEGVHGALISHLTPEGSECAGGINFDTPEMHEWMTKDRPRPMWQVVSWEPLHLEPSIRCSCGDHGFIREGRWVRA